MKRGQEFLHDRRIQADINRTPLRVRVTSTKRYTRSTGEDSTLVYYRPIHQWEGGRVSVGNLWTCDIEDANRWTPVDALTGSH